ncbi:MAG: Mammalian cell entry related domain protein [Solirubrobacterales bacterium]|nr:Mammalian cell entry related domain protein [Solirubrobacterales bacterium]
MSTTRRNPTRRRSSRRARTNHVPPRQVLLRGGIVTLLLLGFIYLATSLYSGVPGRHYRYVKATVPQVGNLIQHDPVRLAGVRIGQVKSVEASSDGTAHLEMQLSPGTELPVDSTLIVRANGLLGARFVQIVPGRSDVMVADGGLIKPDAKQSITFGVPEALDTFDRETRGQLRNTVDGLGRGLTGHGDDLNVFFRRVSDEVVNAQSLFKAITDTGAVPSLLPSVRSGVAPLDANRRNLMALAPATSRALQPVVSERGAVRSLLDAAPGTLDAATAGLSSGTRLLASVRRVAVSARGTLPLAPAGLRTTSRLLGEAGAPLKQANTLLKEADPTVPRLLDVTSALKPVLTPVKAVSDDLNPMVTLLGTYGCDIVNFGTVFRSMTGSAGTGSGPNGAPKAFRLQAIAPSLGEVASIDGTNDPLFVKDAYPAPCKYLSTTYPLAITKVPQK